MKKYLIALPCFPKAKGFNHQTILVNAVSISDAIQIVRHIKGDINIGEIKEVNY
jgi:hypothetical protein